MSKDKLKKDGRIMRMANTTPKGVSPRSGVAPPKHRQFGQPEGNPRSNGAWKKEDTPRYKIEQIIKLEDGALREIRDDPAAPRFEREIAHLLLDNTLERDKKWKIIEGMINQSHGMPSQSVDHTSKGEAMTVMLPRLSGGRE
jgi:hypothetical protein